MLAMFAVRLAFMNLGRIARAEFHPCPRPPTCVGFLHACRRIGERIGSAWDERKVGIAGAGFAVASLAVGLAGA